MDRCFYCGKEYHPMPVWTLASSDQGQVRDWWTGDGSKGKPIEITVCNLNVIYKEDGSFDRLDFGHRKCMERAEADGYIGRPDLTPSR